jgi:nucleoid DNA-binding protein
MSQANELRPFFEVIGQAITTWQAVEMNLFAIFQTLRRIEKKGRHIRRLPFCI